MDINDPTMKLPPNTVPMGTAPGPYGIIATGGMFTVLKIREKLRATPTRVGTHSRRAPTRALRVRLSQLGVGTNTIEASTPNLSIQLPANTYKPLCPNAAATGDDTQAYRRKETL